MTADVKETSLIPVKTETAYQVEVNAARNEIVARLGFNRSLLALQMQVLGIAVAVVGVVAQGKLQIGTSYLEALCGVILWISYAFQSENIVNQSTINALGLFVAHVINRKYAIENAPAQDPCDWDGFHGGRHPQSRVLKQYSLSLLSPGLVVNLLLSIGALAMFIVQCGGHPLHVKIFPLLLVVSGLLANLTAIYRYLQMEPPFGQKEAWDRMRRSVAAAGRFLRRAGRVD